MAFRQESTDWMWNTVSSYIIFENVLWQKSTDWMWNMMISYIIFENGLPAGKYKLDVEYDEFLKHIWEWSLAEKYRLDVEYGEFLYHIWECPFGTKVQTGCGIWWVLKLYFRMAFRQESTDWMWNTVSSNITFANDRLAGKYRQDVEYDDFLYHIWEWYSGRKVQTGCGIRWVLILYWRIVFRYESTDWMWNMVSSYIILENGLLAGKYRLDVEYGDFLYYICEWSSGRKLQTGCGIRWVLISHLKIIFRQENTDWMWNTVSSYIIFENGLWAGKYRLELKYGEFLFHIREWPFDRKVQTRYGIWWFLISHLKMIFWQKSTD